MITMKRKYVAAAVVVLALSPVFFIFQNFTVGDESNYDDVHWQYHAFSRYHYNKNSSIQYRSMEFKHALEAVVFSCTGKVSSDDFQLEQKITYSGDTILVRFEVIPKPTLKRGCRYSTMTKVPFLFTNSFNEQELVKKNLKNIRFEPGTFKNGISSILSLADDSPLNRTIPIFPN